ncbi:MAG: transporter substrate-binding domain-containing protein [Pseudomonadota bacterium]
MGHDNYRLIFDANRGALRSPALLETGDPIFIPCPDGSGAKDRVEALARWNALNKAAELTGDAELKNGAAIQVLTVAEDRAPPEDRAQGAAPEPGASDGKPPGQAGAPAETAPERSARTLPAGLVEQGSTGPAGFEDDAFPPRVRFLTGSDFAPFTDEALPEGGMITELVRRAMRDADASRDYRVTFVNDWAPHLDPLLTEGAFDLGFPWYKPNCDNLDRLSEPMRLRCTDFDFSHPLYEVVVGFYMRSDDILATATEHAALIGKRICRPRGYPTSDLEERGLNDTTVTMIRAATPAECFAALGNGEVDVASVNVLLAEEEVARQSLRGHVVENSDLSTVRTLHVLSPKSNPFGRTYIALINRGLRSLRESGEWFAVVSRHLAERTKRLN